MGKLCHVTLKIKLCDVVQLPAKIVVRKLFETSGLVTYDIYDD